MSPSPPEPLTEEDARILALEKGNIRGHTCKIVVLEGLRSVDEVRAHVAGRVHLAPSLLRRLAPEPHDGPPAWVDDESFDPSLHVRPCPGGPVPADELATNVAALMAAPLDRSRPLWQIDVVHQVGPSATVLVWRVHHCMADGVSVMHLADTLLWDDGPFATPAPPPGLGRSAPGHEARLATALEASPPAGEGTEHHWRHPLSQFARLVPMLRRELAPAHSQSPLARHVGPRREVAFAAVPLAKVKDLAHRAGRLSPALNGPLGPGVTVNDVVLTAVGGALRTWLAGLRSPAVGLRAQVPVSLHHHDPAAEPSANRDSFMFVDLDVADPDPRRRLLAISAQTRERKQSHDAEALDAFLHDLGHVSRHLQELALRWSMSPREFAVNVSNVPGPNRPLSVVGAPVVAVYSLAEVADRHALRVAAISAAGTLSFGLCGDPEVIDGIDRLAQHIESELDFLAAELGSVQS